jgi:hypothetical protein
VQKMLLMTLHRALGGLGAFVRQRALKNFDGCENLRQVWIVNNIVVKNAGVLVRSGASIGETDS